MKRISEIFQTAGGQFLTASEKRDLARTETAFSITGCSQHESQYGIQWVLEVHIKGEARRFGLDANPVRDRQFHDLELALQNGETIAPVRLELKRSPNGKEYFDLEDASAEAMPF
jgi:hypothetical protein